MNKIAKIGIATEFFSCIMIIILMLCRIQIPDVIMLLMDVGLFITTIGSYIQLYKTKYHKK